MDFNMLLRPGVVNAFSTGMQQGQQQVMDQRRMALQEQQAARQAQMSQLQLAKFQRDEAELTQLKARLQAAGQTGDIAEMFKAMAQSPNPELIQKGILGLQKLDEHRRNQAVLGRLFPDLIAATAAPAAAPAAPAARYTGTEMTPAQLAPYQAAAQQGNADAAQMLSAYTQKFPTNAMAPAQPPVNALAQRQGGGITGRSTEELRKAQLMLGGMEGDPRAKTLSSMIEKEIESRKQPDAVRQYEYAKSQGYTGSFADFKQLNRPQQTVNVSTDKAYKGAVAKGGAATDLEIYDAAQAAPNQIAKLDETLSILRSQDINTGIGAELFTVLDQARAQFLADKKAGKRVSSTQYLDSLLGSDVFPQISALGIGAKGLDTPAEREFLRQVMTGTITLNKDTLIKMAELRRKGIESNVTKFNKLVDDGSFDDFFEARRRPKEKVVLPTTPKTASPSLVEQIPAGRGAAAAQPPKPGLTVTRKGTVNGRRVVEYSDGSIVYAD